MEQLRCEIFRSVNTAHEAYNSMVSKSKLDSKALEAYFAPLRKYEGGIPRVFQKQDGPTPVFTVNICYFPESEWKGKSERVSSLQLSGGFFPNQEMPLFSVTEISVPRKIGRRKRPEVRTDKKTLMSVNGWILPSQRQGDYVYSKKTTQEPERSATLAHKR